MSGQRETVTVTVNGTTVTREVEPRTLLVDLLRDHLGLTGTHIGCEEGICGACTVEVDGRIAKSCLMFAVQAEGAEVSTVEDRQNGELDPVQRGLWESHAVQCGFCTPGMVVAARALLRENPSPTEADVRRHLVGNLCRCTGYQSVVAGVQRAGELMREEATA